MQAAESQDWDPADKTMCCTATIKALQSSAIWPQMTDPEASADARQKAVDRMQAAGAFGDSPGGAHPPSSAGALGVKVRSSVCCRPVVCRPSSMNALSQGACN